MSFEKKCLIFSILVGIILGFLIATLVIKILDIYGTN